MLRHLAVHLGAYRGNHALRLRRLQHAVDEFHYPRHLVLFQSAGGDSGCTEAQARGLECRARVERHHVLVGSDVGCYECFLCHFARQVGIFRPQVHQHAVVVRTAGDNLIPLVDERLRHHRRVGLHLLLICHKLRRECLSERHCLRGYHVLQRTALRAGEHRRIQQRRHHLHLPFRRGLAPRVGEVFPHQDDAAARAAQRLVRRGGNDMCMLHGVLQQACGNQSGRVRHVHHEDSPYLVRHLADTRVVPLAAVRTRTGDNQFRTLRTRFLLQLVVVHTPCLLAQAVVNGMEHQS